MRPARPFNPAREAVLMMKTQFIYEKCIDLVECDLFRDNHIK